MPEGDLVAPSLRPNAEIADRLSMVRAKGPYGRKPQRKGPRGLDAIAQYAPVSVHHYDEAEDKSIIETIQDIEPIFENNKQRALDGDGYNKARDMKHVASIPLNIVEMLKTTMNLDVMKKEDWPRLAAILDDPSYAFLRTSTGKVSTKPYREYTQVREGNDKRKNT